MAYDLLQDISDDVRGRAARVRLAAFDVDGTLTDGGLRVGADGREFKVFHVHDGLGLKRLQAHGIEVAIISARISHAVAVRTEELGINHVYQGQNDKATCLQRLLDALHLNADQAAFVGDDLPDLRAMRLAGFAVAMRNAHPTLFDHAHWRTTLSGGHGGVREVCDLLLAAQDRQAAELDSWL